MPKQQAAETEVEDEGQWSIKHRPTKIEDFLGASRVKSQIKNAKGKSAFLVTGMTGCGKTTLATILAYQLANIPYGEQTPDISDINVGDKRTIDDVRAVIASSKYRPSTGSKRVFILDEVHALTATSAPPLLKPLETPSKSLAWILCTDQPEKLLATIVNRCSPITLDIPGHDELRDYLVGVLDKEKALKADGDKGRKKLASAVAEASGQIPRAALQLLQAAVDARGEYEDIKDLIRGPVLKTPSLELDKAAIKIVLCLHKAISEPKKSAELVGKAVGAMANLDGAALMIRLINLLEAVTVERFGGAYVPQAYPLVSAAKQVGMELIPYNLGHLLVDFVDAKQNVGDFSVKPSTLLLTKIIKYDRSK